MENVPMKCLSYQSSTYVFGISQSGRFLRQFVSEGFNADLFGCLVFDGMMIHIAGGGRRSFNERFAQPSRNLVSRVFPFSDIVQTDPETEGFSTRPATPRSCQKFSIRTRPGST